MGFAIPSYLTYLPYGLNISLHMFDVASAEKFKFFPVVISLYHQAQLICRQSISWTQLQFSKVMLMKPSRELKNL
jgi:hypothetical protein